MNERTKRTSVRIVRFGVYVRINEFYRKRLQMSWNRATIEISFSTWMPQYTHSECILRIVHPLAISFFPFCRLVCCYHACCCLTFGILTLLSLSLALPITGSYVLFSVSILRTVQRCAVGSTGLAVWHLCERVCVCVCMRARICICTCEQNRRESTGGVSIQKKSFVCVCVCVER